MDPSTAVGARAARLDRATLTVSVYPDAGEAVVSVGHYQAGCARPGRRGLAIDPERSAASSLARTRRKVRRWCASHKATRLATLTFATEPEDLDAGWAAVEVFRRRLDQAGIPQPLIVPEWGSARGRLHFHCAMPSHVPKDTLAALWGQGFVDIRRPRTRGRATLGAREITRVVAGYVAGYVAKGQTGEGTADPSAPGGGPPPNRKRYSIPKGTTPEPVRFVSFSLFEAWDQAQQMCGHKLAQVWQSPDDPNEWRGPPTLLLMG